MNFTKLKESKLRNKIAKLGLRNNAIHQKKIKTVGILTTDNLTIQFDLQQRIESILEVRNTKMYSFKKFDKLDAVSDKHFSEKDITWKGEFEQPNFKSFLEEPFDLLIGYFETNNIYLELATWQSKALFKVGFSDVNAKLFDIEFSEQEDNIEGFTSELKKYLSILDKL